MRPLQSLVPDITKRPELFMNLLFRNRAWIAAAILTPTTLWAADPVDEIPGLRQASADFVSAYNNKDAAAIANLFTEDGEMVDLNAEDVTSGRDEIRARYEEVLADEDAPSAAIEVTSVRLVAPDTAVEDGTVHFTPPGNDEPARSISYTAVLVKAADGTWKVASSRNLADVTAPAGHLADLADALKGDWTAQRDEMRLDLTVGWDDSGSFLSGEMLVTQADAEPLKTTIRFGWNGVDKSINCWTFDSGGGFAKSVWSQDADGNYSIRNEGTTASEESMTSNQHLTFKGADTFIWAVNDQFINGESQSATTLRVVRRAPEPAVDADTDQNPTQ